MIYVYKHTNEDGIVQNLITLKDYGELLAYIDDIDAYERTRSLIGPELEGCTLFRKYSSYVLGDEDALVNDADMDMSKISSRYLKKRYA